MIAHTPGPWMVRKTAMSDKANYQRCIDYVVETVADVPPDSDEICEITSGAPTVEANARLIAAAPDLEDALLAVYDPIGYCDRTGQDYGVEGWLARKIADALAKAGAR